MKFSLRHIVLTMILVSVSCDGQKPAIAQSPVGNGHRPPPEWQAATDLSYEVVAELPHDAEAYTQGLVLHDGHWIESTGKNGQTTLRRVDPATGAVVLKKNLVANFFGEGCTVLGGKIYQLSWKNQEGFVYDAASFQWQKNFSYTGEGWGLTNDGTSLIMSNGSNILQFIDPVTFKPGKVLKVEWNGQPLDKLNELEFIEGEIFANIWFKDQIVRIDPANGRVIGMIDLAGIDKKEKRLEEDNVLNGIAYDPVTRNIFVTGKCWPKIYQIRLVAAKR
jgi:glutamine cyclotransferase